MPRVSGRQIMDAMNGSSDKVETDEAPGGAPSTPKQSTKRYVPKQKSKPVKRKAVQSTIGFPYRELDTGVAVALAMIGAGGVALTTEQLAGVMGLQAGSGNFVVKIMTARMFGLISNTGGKYALTDIGFAILDKDEKRQRAARAQAFLNVPLYKRTYEEFRGKQLPPRHGLEQAFARFGVSAKQVGVARLAFEKSATQAGYFAAGTDRLIEPIIGGLAPPPAQDDGGGNGGGKRPVEENDGTHVSGFHPFIQGLLDRLPEPDTTWTIEGRAKWLMAAANCFDLLYKGSGEIHIKVMPGPDAKE
jgi:hypothetical protein